MSNTDKFTLRSAQHDELHSMGLAHLLTKPNFDSSMVRVGMIGVRVVSRALMQPYILNYGRVRLKVAMITDLYTSRRYRNRGYAAMIVRDMLMYMVERGVHLALLNDTTPQYFARFGFSSVLPRYVMTFAREDAVTLPMPLQLISVRRGHLPQMAALYQRHWGHRVAFERTPMEWIWRFEHQQQDMRVAVSTDDVVQGYVIGQEILADTPDAAQSIISQLARESQTETIRWIIPPDDAIVLFARDLLNITISAEYAVIGGWMARLIDTQEIGEALLPELVAQGNSAGINTQQLIFQPKADRVMIGLMNRPTTQCYLAHADFIRLMFGAINIMALGIRANLHADGIELLQALFPPRMAMIAPWDWS